MTRWWMVKPIALKMTVHSNHGGTVAGTVGGTLPTIFANIHSDDVIKTVVLACIGAVVSFVISVGLKWVAGKWSLKKN